VAGSITNTGIQDLEQKTTRISYNPTTNETSFDGQVSMGEASCDTMVIGGTSFATIQNRTSDQTYLSGTTTFANKLVAGTISATNWENVPIPSSIQNISSSGVDQTTISGTLTTDQVNGGTLSSSSGILKLNAARTGESEARGIYFRDGFTNYNCSILTYDHNGNFPDGISINGFDGISFCSGDNSRNERMRITQDGKVGIGIGNPSAPLQIRSSSSPHILIGDVNSGSGVIHFGNGGHGVGRATGQSNFTNGNDVVLYTAGTGGTGLKTENGFLKVSSGGNVGIGVANPGSRLEVQSPTGTPANYIRIGSYLTNGSRSISGLEFLANPQFYNGDNAQRSVAFIRSGFYNAYWDSYISFITRTQASNGGEVDTLTCKSGKVGIGTSSPGVKLEIRGSQYDHIGLRGSTSGRYNISTNSIGSQLIFTHGSYSWGVWANAHHYDVYSASNFTGNRDLFLNFYSGGIVRLANYVVVTSDDRIKTNERYIENATETLLKLKPQIYDKGASLGGGGKTRVESGLIVQDVYYDAPELRHLIHHDEDAEIPDEKPFIDNDPQNDPDYSMWGSKSPGLYYEGFIAYLIKSNQEQQGSIETLQKALKSLTERVAFLENESLPYS